MSDKKDDYEESYRANAESIHTDSSQARPSVGYDVVYDPSVIQRFAQILYNWAFWIVCGNAVIGSIVGIIVGVIVRPWALQSDFVLQAIHYLMTGAPVNESGPLIIVPCLALGLFLGIVIGLRKAFWFKLQAQLALCQVQIEKNTRH